MEMSMDVVGVTSGIAWTFDLADSCNDCATRKVRVQRSKEVHRAIKRKSISSCSIRDILLFILI